jgi:hypothetical protein
MLQFTVLNFFMDKFLFFQFICHLLKILCRIQYLCKRHDRQELCSWARLLQNHVFQYCLYENCSFQLSYVHFSRYKSICVREAGLPVLLVYVK